MKKLQLVLISLGFAISASSFAQVTIGSSDTDASAILELVSDQKGFLLPTMTNQQRLEISDPAKGLQVYVTDFQDGIIMLYNGTEWKAFTELITCPEPPTIGTASISAGEATITFTPPSESENGGSAITFYEATSDPEGATGTVDASPENGSITVSGLSANIPYTFTITATNDIDTSLPSKPSNVVPAPEVGDLLYGGVVFYLLNKDDPGYKAGETHGLICAPKDLTSKIPWSSSNTSIGITHEDFRRMGHGKTNTDIIIAKLGEDNYAAYQATLYDLGDGYTGWYLPSKDELNKMYEKRETIKLKLEELNGMAFKDDYYYWSSSEESTTHAWIQNLSSSTFSGAAKTSEYLVRPIRSF